MAGVQATRFTNERRDEEQSSGSDGRVVILVEHGRAHQPTVSAHCETAHGTIGRAAAIVRSTFITVEDEAAGRSEPKARSRAYAATSFTNVPTTRRNCCTSAASTDAT